MKFSLIVCAALITTFACAKHGNGNGNQSQANQNNTTVTQSLDKSTLSEEQKYSLAYMWHEEKLARDIYLELNKVNPARQLENIATRSEVKHIARVQELVEAYDINITNLADYEINYSAEELDSMPTGVFAVPEIQELYDMLYDKGLPSKQASLEVGCMVEVVDIDDLDKFIEEAGDNQYLIDAFTFLRDGSYKHYWAFDKGLKNMGVSEGCCSLGEEYCHPEYPQSTKGKGGKGNRGGKGRR
jgi:hypothetical protein